MYWPIQSWYGLKPAEGVSVWFSLTEDRRRAVCHSLVVPARFAAHRQVDGGVPGVKFPEFPINATIWALIRLKCRLLK
jgi:hypothetical protein